MHELTLSGDVRVALSHAAAYGLAAILDDAGAADVTVSWSPSLDARAVVANAHLDALGIASAVRGHAAARDHAGAWLAAVSEVGGARVGRLSPRVKVPADTQAWLTLEAERRETIDVEVGGRRWLDLAFIGALGEPAYWRHDRTGASRPDEGASRWEMKTRNRGEDFVQHRLRGLATAVATRDEQLILDGLTGRRVVDEVGGGESSRTATGLASPGSVDNAVGWCALWGLSMLPVVHFVDRPSATAGHGTARVTNGSRAAWFHLPVMHRPLTVARLASLLASEELASVARSSLDEDRRRRGLADRSAARWLVDRRVAGLVRFPVGVFGSASAPERRALLGTVIRLTP